MAKTSAINRNKKRRKMVARFAERRATLKKTANDDHLSMEERFQARLTLAALPRNSSKVAPAITRAPTLASGTPVALLTNGIVRLARGFASST